MSIKESILPKALNIIRPSSPLVKQQQQDYSHSTSTSSSSSPSTISTISTNSAYNYTQPTIINPSNYTHFQNTWATFKSTNPVANPVGVNPYRFLQRPRSNSNLSRSTYFSTLSLSSHSLSDDEEEEEEEEDNHDLNSIDGLSEDEQEEEEPVETKVVAKVKNGTILNGKGEFLNKGSPSTDEQWLDEARANRKIADLEIEKASLLVLNSTLEAKLRQQTLQIAELQKRLQMNEGPPTPTSTKHVEELLLFDDENTVVSSPEDEEMEHDQVFQRIKSMLENLILQAEVALLQKTKQSGKVLQDYKLPIKDEEKQFHVEETLHKLTKRPSRVDIKTQNSRQISPNRRASESVKASSVKMSRTLSRQSSPPVLVSSPRTITPPPPTNKILSRRSTSPRQQKPERAKWHF